MKWVLLVEIAFTLLKARLRQTIVAAVGVTFGITMFIALLSFMTGLNQLLDGLVGNRTPHVRLYNEVQTNAVQPIDRLYDTTRYHNFISSVKAANLRISIYNAQRILQTLNKDLRVLGVSRKATSQVFFTAGTLEITGVMNGIDVDKELAYYKFNDYMAAGNALDIAQFSNTIILGKPLAEKLMVNIGDMVQIATVQGERFQLKVVGLYQSGIADFDKTQSFVAVNTVQKVLGKPSSYVTDINVKLKDVALASAVAKEYRQLYGIATEDFFEANAQFETGTKIRTIISYAVGITLLIVAGFGIYNILNMMIYEKMDTIAILKATGFSGADVRKIFLFISISIGLMGCITGMLFGNILSRIIDQIPFNAPALPTLKTFPIVYNPAFYAIAAIFSLITTYLAGFFPARKAGNVDPVVIIRGK